ncbi:MAG: hypothetical protein GW938_11450 [Leptospira sp.]|nr:hypothetical protein [Leptospira sp.]
MIANLPEFKYIAELNKKLSFYSKSRPSLLLKGRTGCRNEEILKSFLIKNSLDYYEIDFRLVNNEKLFYNEWKLIKNKSKILLLISIESIPKDIQSLLFKELLNLRIQENKTWILSICTDRISLLLENNKFIIDLYNILSVSILDFLPISEQKKEIPIIAKFYLDYYAQYYKKRIKYFEEQYLQLLLKYDFIGDLEELENLIHQSVIAGKGRTLMFKDIPKNFYENSKSKYDRKLNIIPGVTLKEYEKEIFKENLIINKGNRELTAKVLDISIRTFYRKLDEHNLKDLDLK